MTNDRPTITTPIAILIGALMIGMSVATAQFIPRYQIAAGPPGAILPMV